MSAESAGPRRVTISRIQPKDGASGLPELLILKEKKKKQHQTRETGASEDDEPDSPLTPKIEIQGTSSMRSPSNGKGVLAAAGLHSERMRMKVRPSISVKAVGTGSKLTVPGTDSPASSPSILLSPSIDSHRQSKTGSLARPNKVADVAGSSPTVGPNLRTPKVGEEEEDLDDEFKQRFVHSHNGAAGLKARLEEQDLPESYHEMVKNNPLHWADPDFAKAHSDEVWNHYTSHQKPSGRDARYMDHHGLTRLSDDTVERFLERYRAELVRTNPKLNAAEIEQAMLKELPHCPISFGSKIITEIKTNVATHLKKELDRDHDGRIGRMEFIVQWKPAVTALMETPKKQKDLCVIL